MVERWWNGKRVRWLDENGDLRPSDTRGRPGRRRSAGRHGRRRHVRRRQRPERQVGRRRRRRAGRRPAWSTQPPVWGEGGKCIDRRVALDALLRRREGRRPRLAGLAQVRLRGLELGARRARPLEVGLPRRRPLPEDPPAPAGAARPAPQLGEPLRVLRQGRRRPDRDGHALARPHDAGREGPLARSRASSTRPS